MAIVYEVNLYSFVCASALVSASSQVQSRTPLLRRPYRRRSMQMFVCLYLPTIVFNNFSEEKTRTQLQTVDKDFI